MSAWESVNEIPDASYTERLAVPGGWLYKVTQTVYEAHASGDMKKCAQVTLCFVPDPTNGGV